ncbi:DsrE family protein [Qipengyuania nanhaisediminis]|uniref:DsrE family protein n=1 Tax=Qipengyuania nanhaisediminis TaxID=604088 RepID=UPI0038B2E6E0
MSVMNKPIFAAFLAMLLASPANAQADLSAFETGPVFDDFGPHAPVEMTRPLAQFERFAIAFDVARKAEDGTRNRGFESAARFLNMHVGAGVLEDRIELAVVVHGSAVHDLVAREGNGSAEMVRAMIDAGVRFIVCGQSAAAHGVTNDALIEGVEMDLSAMTAHALLQQQGYTLNPF